MTHTSTPQFLVFDEGIINIHDISTVVPARKDGRPTAPDLPAEGVRVTFRSKGTSLYLHQQTLKGFESRLNGAVF